MSILSFPPKTLHLGPFLGLRWCVCACTMPSFFSSSPNYTLANGRAALVHPGADEGGARTKLDGPGPPPSLPLPEELAVPVVGKIGKCPTPERPVTSDELDPLPNWAKHNRGYRLGWAVTEPMGGPWMGELKVVGDLPPCQPCPWRPIGMADGPSGRGGVEK